jgi:hypothetical protein
MKAPPLVRQTRQPTSWWHHEDVYENTYTRTSGFGLYVQVKVTLEPSDPSSVAVSPNAFWRFGDHGGAYGEYYVAVKSGATSALREAEAGGAVTILDVDYAPAHTSTEDVKLASSIAVHNALRKASGW